MRVSVYDIIGVDFFSNMEYYIIQKQANQPLDEYLYGGNYYGKKT